MSRRVLFVIPGSPKVSSMIFAKRQAAALARAGATVETFFLASRTRPVVVWREWRRLRGAIRAFRPDVVHAAFGTATALVCVLATRCPVVITFYGGDLNPGATRPWIRSVLGRFMSQLAAARAAGLICVSDELRRRLWWRQADTVVIPTGVDTTTFRPMARADARARLGWDDAPTVLFNSSGDPRRKRLDLAQAAVAQAQKQLPALRLEVTQGNVPPERMPHLMNAADVLLITSDSEGSPTVVHEAMACGLPIVSVPVGDVVEQLQGLSLGAVAERDPVRIGEALVSILRAGRRSNGPVAVARRSYDALALQILAVYDRAAAGAS